MKSATWWLKVALGLLAGGILSLIAFMALVWPPGIFLVLSVVLIGGAFVVDVPKRARPKRP